MHCKKKKGLDGPYERLGQAFSTLEANHAAVESFLLHVHTSKGDDGCTSREVFGQAVYALQYFGKKLCIEKNWGEQYNIKSDVVHVLMKKLPAKARGKIGKRMDAGELRPRALSDAEEEALHRACFGNVARVTCRSALAWTLRAILRGVEYRSFCFQHIGMCQKRIQASVDPVEIVTYCFNFTKTNNEGGKEEDTGHPEVVGCKGHMNALICPINPSFLSISVRFSQEFGGNSLPDFVEDLDAKPWYDVHIYTPVNAKPFGKPMSDRGHRDIQRKIYNEVGMSKKDLGGKVTHLKGFHARRLAFLGVSERNVAKAGRWSREKMKLRLHYLTDIVPEVILKSAGVYNESEYILPGGRVQPHADLLKSIWPELDEYWEAYNALPIKEQEKDTAAGFCIEAVLFGRKVILQDLVVLRKTIGEDSFTFKHCAFRGKHWKEFCLAMDHEISMPHVSTQDNTSLATMIATGLKDAKAHITLELKSFDQVRKHHDKELPAHMEIAQPLSKAMPTLKRGGWATMEELWRELAISSETKFSYLEAKSMGSHWRLYGDRNERRNASNYWSK